MSLKQRYLYLSIATGFWETTEDQNSVNKITLKRLLTTPMILMCY